MANFIFDEFSIEMLTGAIGFDWNNNDIYMGVFSDASEVTPDMDYATVIALLVDAQPMVGRTVTNTGVAAGDAILFEDLVLPNDDRVGGIVIFRETPTQMPLVTFGAQAAGVDNFDLLSPMFIMEANGINLYVTPNATDKGWFKP